MTIFVRFIFFIAVFLSFFSAALVGQGHYFATHDQQRSSSTKKQLSWVERNRVLSAWHENGHAYIAYRHPCFINLEVDIKNRGNSGGRARSVSVLINEDEIKKRKARYPALAKFNWKKAQTECRDFIAGKKQRQAFFFPWTEMHKWIQFADSRLSLESQHMLLGNMLIALAGVEFEKFRFRKVLSDSWKEGVSGNDLHLYRKHAANLLGVDVTSLKTDDNYQKLLTAQREFIKNIWKDYGFYLEPNIDKTIIIPLLVESLLLENAIDFTVMNFVFEEKRLTPKIKQKKKVKMEMAVAIHEAGHALLIMNSYCFAINKVTIIPDTKSAGKAQYRTKDDIAGCDSKAVPQEKKFLEESADSVIAGVLAERILLGRVWTYSWAPSGSDRLAYENNIRKLSDFYGVDSQSYEKAQKLRLFKFMKRAENISFILVLAETLLISQKLNRDDLEYVFFNNRLTETAQKQKQGKKYLDWEFLDLDISNFAYGEFPRKFRPMVGSAIFKSEYFFVFLGAYIFVFLLVMLYVIKRHLKVRKDIVLDKESSKN